MAAASGCHRLQPRSFCRRDRPGIRVLPPRSMVIQEEIRMWETVIATAGGLMGLYIALRREIRRSYELLDKDIAHLDSRLTQEGGRLHEGLREVRADIRWLTER